MASLLHCWQTDGQAREVPWDGHLQAAGCPWQQSWNPGHVPLGQPVPLTSSRCVWGAPAERGLGHSFGHIQKPAPDSESEKELCL